MKIKLLMISALFLCATGLPVAQSMTMTPITIGSQTVVDENRMSGVVAKVTKHQIEINGVVYDFDLNRVRLFDFNGLPNQKAQIKIGTFVNFVVAKNKRQASVVELRLIRK